jgi:hypothetical protein
VLTKTIIQTISELLLINALATLYSGLGQPVANPFHPTIQIRHLFAAKTSYSLTAPQEVLCLQQEVKNGWWGSKTLPRIYTDNTDQEICLTRNV